MKEFTYIIEPEEEEERIDKWISGTLPSLSRSYIQKLIRENSVWVNGRAQKASYRVKAEDIICFRIPDASQPSIPAENIPLSILYEDEDILIVDKPKGMVVHPAPGHYSGTLVNAVLFHCKDNLSGINGILRPGIVHRIDKDTTGSLIVCKNDTAHQFVASQLKEHSITRKYRAIIHGRPDIMPGRLEAEEGCIDAPIGRDEKDRKKMAVNEKNGKRAVTHYKILKTFREYSYIECRLETGRTHQIRVHMASIGHPLLGDTVYGGNRKTNYHLEGQTLHAMTIGLKLPSTGAYLEVSAPLPAYFEHLLEILE
ncbi:MAG: RluA family pseudouridine synthase [Blautia sp.]|nr:RluA family pseudouridine synthase [Blautia sp.]MCM1200557.1 RluA family pseudouridine synthase [Bacteroides fragilis]